MSGQPGLDPTRLARCRTQHRASTKATAVPAEDAFHRLSFEEAYPLPRLAAAPTRDDEYDAARRHSQILWLPLASVASARAPVAVSDNETWPSRAQKAARG